MEIPDILVLLVLPAADREDAVLDDDAQIVFAEAGNRHHDAVRVFAGLLDVVRRIRWGRVLDARRRLEQASETVEADGGAE